MKAGLPWSILEQAPEGRILLYYGFALAEREYEAEITASMLGAR